MCDLPDGKLGPPHVSRRVDAQTGRSIYMVLQLPGGEKGERMLKQYQKPARDRAIDEGLPEVPDAAKVIARMEKDLAGLKKKVNALESRTFKLWGDKVQRDIVVAQEVDSEAAKKGRGL